jgi:hypothetical protein
MISKFNLDRRNFIKTTSFGVVGTSLFGNKHLSGFEQDTLSFPQSMIKTGKELIIQPLLRHQIEERIGQTSWRNWGDVHTEPDALQEVARITAELDNMKKSADFPIKILPVKRATSDSEGEKIKLEMDYDVMLLCAAGCDDLDPCISDDRFNLVFIRHTSGPMYNATNRFLRKSGKLFEIDSLRYYGPYHGVGPDDVIVDDYDEVLWKLKTLYGIHNFLGKKIPALRGASGKMSPTAPEVARTRFKLDMMSLGRD